MFLKAFDKTALVWNEENISYPQLLDNIQTIAQSFSHSSYQQVVIFAENRPEWVYHFYAAWKLNAIVIPIDFMSAAGDVSYILNDCQPDLIIYSAQTQAVLEQAMAIKDIPCEQVNMDAQSLPLTKTSGTESLSSYVEFPPDKTAVIIYTSGTTGNPKGVMLSFDNLLANVEAVSQEINIYTINDRVMVLF